MPVLLAAAGGEPSDAAAVRLDGTADRAAAPARRVEEPANQPLSARTANGEGGVSRESLRRRSVSALLEAQGGHANVFDGAISVRRNLQLHLARSSDRLPVGPEAIKEIPVQMKVSTKSSGPSTST